MEKDGSQHNGPRETTLVEIGPRFVLNPIRIFEGAFGGATVFSNPGTSSLKIRSPYEADEASPKNSSRLPLCAL